MIISLFTAPAGEVLLRISSGTHVYIYIYIYIHIFIDVTHSMIDVFAC